MLSSRLSDAVTLIRSRYEHPIQAGLILGSGLGAYAESIPNAVVIPYEEIPHFHQSTVEGHSGNLVLGELRPGFHVACMQGRFHFYEGHDMETVVFPARVMKLLGAEILLVTNAAGGINVNFTPGTLMMIEDHINFLGTNPLIGKNIDELGPRFPAMQDAYHPELRALLETVAKEKNIPLQKGVYLATTGPSYETGAEIKMMRGFGADAVGMSTVPEVIAANHMAMKVLGISCITNLAADISPERLNHQEVMETANRVKAQFIELLDGFFDYVADDLFTFEEAENSSVPVS